jgi:hypothetical protein
MARPRRTFARLAAGQFFRSKRFFHAERVHAAAVIPSAARDLLFVCDPQAEAPSITILPPLRATVRVRHKFPRPSRQS